MKECRGVEAQLHIADLGVRWRWVASHTPRPLYPQGVRPRLHAEEETGCTPTSSWAFWKRQESLSTVILRRCGVKCDSDEYRLFMTALKLAVLMASVLPARGARQTTPLSITLQTVMSKLIRKVMPWFWWSAQQHQCDYPLLYRHEV